jgi:acetyltransferase-like isoleucine patch superfamily enzyme
VRRELTGMLITKERLPYKEILTFGLLPGPVKKLVYRLRGHKIGSHVSIGFGSVVCAENVSIGNHTKIGFFTIIRGKSVTIGSHVNIGAMTFLDTPYIEIGDGSRINEQVYVGGLQFPDSRFVLGKNCQIMQMSFINPSRSILVGDDTGIGGHCLIFGHTSWLSQFEGYPVEFDSIEIGNSVSLAWRVFVLPGTKIGDGAVIGANSLVHRTIPPKCLAVGFPARVVSKYPEFPRDVSKDEKVDLLRNIVLEMIQYFGDSGLICEDKGNIYTVTSQSKGILLRKKRKWSLAILYHGTSQDDPILNERHDLILSLENISVDFRSRLSRQNSMWIDVEKKERSSSSNELGEEVALYLKRYGVRLNRVEA